LLVVVDDFLSALSFLGAADVVVSSSLAMDGIIGVVVVFPKLKPVPAPLPPNALLELPNMFLLSFFPLSLPPLLANE